MRDGLWARRLAAVGCASLLAGLTSLTASATSSRINWQSTPVETPQSHAWCDPNAIALAGASQKNVPGGDAGAGCADNPPFNGKPYIQTTNLHDFWSIQDETQQVPTTVWPLLGAGLIRAFNNSVQTFSYWDYVQGVYNGRLQSSGWQRLPEPSVQGNGQTPGVTCPPIIVCPRLTWSSFGIQSINASTTIWIGVSASGPCGAPGYHFCFPEGQMMAPENPHGSEGAGGPGASAGSAVTSFAIDTVPPPPITTLHGTWSMTPRGPVYSIHWLGLRDNGDGIGSGWYVDGIQGYDVYEFVNSNPSPSEGPQMTSCLDIPPQVRGPYHPPGCSGVVMAYPDLGGAVDSPGLPYTEPAVLTPRAGQYLHLCGRSVDWLAHISSMTCEVVAYHAAPVPTITLQGPATRWLGQPNPTIPLHAMASSMASSEHIEITTCVTPETALTLSVCPTPVQALTAPAGQSTASLTVQPPPGGPSTEDATAWVLDSTGTVVATSNTVPLNWYGPSISLASSPANPLKSRQTATLTVSLANGTPFQGSPGVPDPWTIAFTASDRGQGQGASCTMRTGQSSCQVAVTRTVAPGTSKTVLFTADVVTYPSATAQATVVWGAQSGGGGGPGACTTGGRVQSNPPDNTIVVWNLTNYYVSCSRVRLGVIRTWTVARSPIRMCVPGPRRRVQVLGPPLTKGGPPHATWHWVPGPPVCHWQARPPWVYVDTMIRLGVRWSWSANGLTPATSETLYGPFAMGLPYPAEIVTNVWKYDSQHGLVTIRATQRLQEVQTRDGVVQWRRDSSAAATPEVSQVEQVEGVPVGP